MKKQHKHEQESRPPRNVMEARALGYTEETIEDEREDFLTPNKIILTGYMVMRYSYNLNPPLRVPFTAKYSYGRPEAKPEKAGK